MSISAGFTHEEIREFVYEYERQPHGQKRKWLAGQSFTLHQLHRWQGAVFNGDLERGFISHDRGATALPAAYRKAMAHRSEQERQQREQIAKLEARVQELESTNEALGKAIGLLHQLSEHEPEDSPTVTDHESSSPTKTGSSAP